MTKKLLIAPFLLVFACLIAGLFSAIYWPIAGAISPEFFAQSIKGPKTDYSFTDMAIIGFSRSFYLGVPIGTPALLICLLAKTCRKYIQIFVSASLIVALTSLVLGLAGLAYAMISVSDTNLPEYLSRYILEQPTDFARAVLFRDFFYIGRWIGSILALAYVIWKLRPDMEARLAR